MVVYLKRLGTTWNDLERFQTTWNGLKRLRTTSNRQIFMPPMGFEATISAGELARNFVEHTLARSPAPSEAWIFVLSVVCCQVEVTVMSNCSILFYRVIMDETELQRFTKHEEIQTLQTFKCCGNPTYSASPTSTWGRGFEPYVPFPSQCVRSFWVCFTKLWRFGYGRNYKKQWGEWIRQSNRDQF
jgi:hypothetical protein